MKRSSHELAGGPRLGSVQPAVAGRRAPEATKVVASTSSISATHPMAQGAADEAALLRDFVDFMGGDEDLDPGLLPAPDPTFRERLRRRFWWIFVMTYLRDGELTH